MRIAQVAPLFESVPPRLYGGTERVVSYLTEELVRLGHEVTLFASGDSRTSAELVAVCPDALRMGQSSRFDAVRHVMMMELVRRRQADFDVIHFHADPYHLTLARALRRPQLTTLHGRLDQPELLELYAQFADLPLVSISTAQRAPLPDGNFVATIHHGIAESGFEPQPVAGNYLVLVGRISPEKGIDRAIDIAERVGMPLRIAAKIEELDRDYYARIRPRLECWPVEYLGELGGAHKMELMRNAYAMLFPIDWPEPFGLVMVESMCAGTPVIGWRRGSVPEVVEEGVTGFVVESVDEAVEALAKVATLDRRRCAEVARRRFSVQRMTADYLTQYARLIRGSFRDTISAA